MRVEEIRHRALAIGLFIPARMRKADLVRAIQKAEGNPECFASGRRNDCPETGCCWRQDCRAAG